MSLIAAILLVHFVHSASAAYVVNNPQPPPQGVIYNPYPIAPIAPFQPYYYPSQYPSQYPYTYPYNQIERFPGVQQPVEKDIYDDDPLRRHINQYRLSVSLKPVNRSAPLSDAAQGILNCLIQYNVNACSIPPRIYFGYTSATSPKDALKKVFYYAVNSNNLDEFGQPIVSTGENKGFASLLGEGQVSEVQGVAAWDVRYQKYLYVINYS
jgi:hypothetical protein